MLFQFFPTLDDFVKDCVVALPYFVKVVVRHCSAALLRLTRVARIVAIMSVCMRGWTLP